MAEVVAVFGGKAAAQLVPARQVVEPAVTLDRARNLEAGRAQKPDILADLPVDRDHDLRRQQAVVARLAAARDRLMSFPRKLSGPIDARDTRKDVLEKSALMTDSPSATIVPLPTEARYGVSCFTSQPKFDPVCTTGGKGRTRGSADSGRCRSCHRVSLREELAVGQARDRPVDRVVETVQAGRPCPA